jgi:hypothetical protein
VYRVCQPPFWHRFALAEFPPLPAVAVAKPRVSANPAQHKNNKSRSFTANSSPFGRRMAGRSSLTILASDKRTAYCPKG